MIADGDSVARNAFRLAMLTAAPEETPLPNTTQELDPSDILEVRDMAEAIARAEQIVAAPRSSHPASRRNVSDAPDIFDALGHTLASRRRPTDDTAGPATPAPDRVTPIGQPPHRDAAVLVRPASVPVTLRSPGQPSNMVLSLPTVPAPSSAMNLPENDAYFHPAGRIRSLADVTLDGYRPEPTLLLRARGRRRSFVWVLAAVLVPALVLTVIAVLGREDAKSATVTTGAVTSAEAQRSPPIATTPVRGTPARTDAPLAVPVFDVKNLPTSSREKSRR
jgi:hypothetical protein